MAGVIIQREAVRSAIGFTSALAITLLLTACSKSVETRVSSAGMRDFQASNFQVTVPDPSASPQLQLAYRLVIEKLAEKGMKPRDDGALQLEVGISARPANIGIKQPGKTIATPGKAKVSRQCSNQEYRISIALTRIADGAEQFRGSASETHCKQGLSEILPFLTDKATADLGSPRGDYVLKRVIRS
jgi:hypothetical protein